MSNPNEPVVVHDESDRSIAIRRLNDLSNALRAKDANVEDYFLALVSLCTMYCVDVNGSLLREFHSLTQDTLVEPKRKL